MVQPANPKVNGVLSFRGVCISPGPQVIWGHKAWALPATSVSQCPKQSYPTHLQSVVLGGVKHTPGSLPQALLLTIAMLTLILLILLLCLLLSLPHIDWVSSQRILLTEKEVRLYILSPSLSQPTTLVMSLSRWYMCLKSEAIYMLKITSYPLSPLSSTYTNTCWHPTVTGAAVATWSTSGSITCVYHILDGWQASCVAVYFCSNIFVVFFGNKQEINKQAC